MPVIQNTTTPAPAPAPASALSGTTGSNPPSIRRQRSNAVGSEAEVSASADVPPGTLSPRDMNVPQN